MWIRIRDLELKARWQKLNAATPIEENQSAVQFGWSRKWIFLLTRKSTFFRKYFYLRVITRKYS
jgi:hypothetical protein